MITITKAAVTALLTFCLLGCDELTGAKTSEKAEGPTVGGLAYVQLSPQKIRFQGTMANGGDASHNFELRLRPNEDLATFTFFSNLNLSDGIELSIRKEGQQAHITLTINGFSHSTHKSLNSDGTLSVSLDIHNDHEDTHVLAWDINGPYEDSEECAYEGTCVYNTESFTDPNPGPWGSQGKGAGSFWGFEGDKNIIIEIKGPLGPLSNA